MISPNAISCDVFVTLSSSYATTRKESTTLSSHETQNNSFHSGELFGA